MSGKGRYKRFIAIMALAAATLLLSAPSRAEPFDRHRQDIAARLFPATLAADTGLRGRVDDGGRLRIHLVHLDNPYSCQRIRERLLERGSIAGLLIEPLSIAAAELESQPAEPLGAVFVCQRLGDALGSAVVYATRRGALLFSPFDGDVERGAHAGIRISDRILPLLNRRAVDEAGIQLKPFFLGVAEII